MAECIWKGKDGTCLLHSEVHPEIIIEYCVEGPCPDYEEWEEDEQDG